MGERAAVDRTGPADQGTAVAAATAFVLRSARARPQTVAELRDKLASRGFTDGVIDAAIARGIDAGALDDAAFARAWVGDRGLTRGYATGRLRRELRDRSVPEPLIDDALAQLDDRDDLAVVTELARARAQRMPARLPPETVARRLIGFLARRGYPEGLARRVAVEVSGLDRAWD